MPLRAQFIGRRKNVPILETVPVFAHIHIENESNSIALLEVGGLVIVESVDCSLVK